MTPGLTIGITTRDRPEALRACLESLRLLDSLHPEIIVFDDGSQQPVAGPALTGPTVRVIRDDSAPGTIVGRNRLMREAAAEFVLLLDDDAQVLTRESIESAMQVMAADPMIGAIGFAQANLDGTPWPVEMQPSRAQRPAVVAAYIGFAHLLRRSTFLQLGGYREVYVFYGEEKDYCLRMFAAGHLTVYLPALRVAHVPAAQNRSRQRYLRLVARNDLLQSVCNDPMSRAFWMVPARFGLYFRMRRQWQIRDPWGGIHLLADIWRRLPAALRERRPVPPATIAAWRTLHTTDVPYSGPGGSQVPS